MSAAFVFFLNHLAEGNGSAHGVVQCTFFATQTVFRQGFPTADDFGGIVYFQFAARIIAQQFLQSAFDMRLVDC